MVHIKKILKKKREKMMAANFGSWKFKGPERILR